MANKFHNKDAVPNTFKGGGGPKEKGPGSVPQPKEGTANWPGLPGKAGKSRAAGTPTRKSYVKQEGL